MSSIKDYYPAFLTIILLITLGFFYNTKQNLEKTRNDLNVAMNNLGKLTSISNNQFIVEHNNWSAQLNKLNNSELLNINDKHVTLYEMLDDKNLILYFSNVMCSECVKEEIEHFKSLIKIIDDSINTLVLVNGYKNGVIYQNDQLKSIENEVYQMKDPLFKETLNAPNPMILLTRGNQIIISYTALKNTNLNFDFFYELFQINTANF